MASTLPRKLHGSIPDYYAMAGLYIALHDFDCHQQHVLTFTKGQIVEITKASSSTNWHRGRINGKAGFLPANGYLKQIDFANCSKVIVRQDFDAPTSGQLKVYEGQVLTVVAKNDLQWWTARAESGKWGQVPAKYLKVLENNNSVEANVTVHSPAPEVVISKPPPLSRTQSQFPISTEQFTSSIPRSSTISRSSAGSTSPGAYLSGKHKAKRRDAVKISSSLVEDVRRKGVNYQISKEIVTSMLLKLSAEYPEWDEQLSQLSKALVKEEFDRCDEVVQLDRVLSESRYSQTPLTWTTYPKHYGHIHDLQSNSVDSLKLEQLFEQLIALTEDEQQRGWSCKDDTAEISAMLTDLFNLLKNANPNVIIRVLQNLKYEPMLTLVQYYQLEKRAALKRQVLEVLNESMLLNPDPICSILLTSRLPIQLATDIQSTKVLAQLDWQCKVFSTCLSYNNVMPRSHFDQLDDAFLGFLLAQIEQHDIPHDPEEVIPPMFLKCLLALNLHYLDLKQNRLCSLLKSRTHATVLTEMILVAFNRCENLTGYHRENKNSVFKLMTDMFGSPDTAELFFTNDVKVLLEVLHRNVIDRTVGDKERHVYLNLIGLVVSNTDYRDHSHLKSDLYELLKQVKEEDSTDTDSRALAATLLKKHKKLLT